MKKHLFLIGWLVVWFGGVVIAQAQEEKDSFRHFTGFVRDAENKPVVGAMVCGWDRSGRPINGRIPCIVSQKDGGFSIGIPKWEGDTYYIYVYDTAKGYPYPNSALYESKYAEQQSADVAGTDESKPVEFRLGQKAGRAILEIVYDESGKPVESGQVTMCRTDQPEICQSLATAFPKGVIEILTPAEPVLLKIGIADGKKWKQWFAYDENNILLETIQVDPGGQKEIKIRVRQ